MWTKEGAEASWRLAQLVLSTLILILGVICIVGIACSALASSTVISPGFHKIPGKFATHRRAHARAFSVHPFRLHRGGRHGHAEFAEYFRHSRSSASTIFNIVSVISGVFFAWLASPHLDWRHPHFGAPALYGWCFGVLIGGVAQLGVQLPALWGLGFRFKWKLDFADPALRTVLLLMIPSAIAGSAVQINVLVTQSLASPIPASQSWLYYAFRLVQLPIGIFGVAIATVTLPAVARQHALDDLHAFGKTVEEALRFGFYLTLPASVGLAIIAYPVIELIYEHGTFTPQATANTALALQAYTVGLVGYSGIKILVPCFYAMQPPRFDAASRPGAWAAFTHFLFNVVLFTPSRVSLIGIALNLALCYLLYFHFHLGHVGLALATGLIAVLNFLQLLYAIQKKIALGDAREWLEFFLRVSGATAACGFTIYFADHYLLGARSTHSILGAIILFFNIGLAGLVYFIVSVALRVPESEELAGFIQRKFIRPR